MSRDDIRRTLICYDVVDDKRRGRLAKVLGKYGDRIQYSVFVVDISPARFLRLKEEVTTKIQLGEDSVLFCDLGRVSELSENRFSYLGRKREITGNDVLIL